MILAKNGQKETVGRVGLGRTYALLAAARAIPIGRLPPSTCACDSPARTNPGLIDGIPLGFVEGDLQATPWSRFSNTSMRALLIHLRNVGSLFLSEETRKTFLLARVRATRKLQIS